MKKFPKHIWLRWEADPNSDEGGYWVVETDVNNAASIGEKVKVGVYELRGIDTIETKIILK